MLPAIVHWSLRRPRLVVYFTICFLVFGALYVSGSKLDIFPELAPARAVIHTEATGLVPEQVEQLVTRPIETVVVGSAGVASVHSESVQGLSLITVDFAHGSDPIQAFQAIAARLTQISGQLPPGAGPPRTEPLTPATGEILKVGFTSDRLSPMDLRSFVQWEVRPRLLSTPGVARVAVYGGQVRRIEVRARPGDLSDSDLGLLDVVRAVRRSTSVAGAGFIDTPVQRVPIEPHGQAVTTDDVAAGQIQTPGNAPVRIGDVADVVDAPAPALGDALIDGKPGVLVGVTGQYGINTLDETHAVERAIAEIQPALKAQGVTVVPDLDRPAGLITSAVAHIAIDLMIGAGLVLVLLLAFLRDARAALISFLAIPLSLLAAMVALRLFGLSLNTMTLGGLALALGIVIDDAVIDVENILTRLRDADARHASHAEAVFRASLEVRAPVVFAALAVAVAFLPVILLPGALGALLGPLAVAALVACLASLLAALVVTPALALLFLPHVRPSTEPALLTRLKQAHADWLGRRSGAPLPVVWGVIAVVLLAAVAAALLRTEGLPDLHGGRVGVEVAAPATTSLEAMRAYGRRISADILALPGVMSVAQDIGRDPTDARAWGVERSAFDVELKPGSPISAQERTASKIRGLLGAYPGLAANVRAGVAPLDPALATSASFAVTVHGADLDALDAAAASISQELAAIPGAGDVRIASASPGSVVRVDLKFQRLRLYGLSAADVLETLQTAFEGQNAAEVYEEGRPVDVAVTAQTNLRQDPESVGALLLRSTSGVSTPLKNVADVYLADSRTSVVHDGGLRRQIVTASPRPQDADAFARTAKLRIARRVRLPPGVYLAYQAPTANEDRDALLAGAAVAVLGVVALLCLAFGDVRAVALILVSTLFAFAGGVAVVALTGGVLTPGAMVGFIALLGISVRSAMLLFARLQELARVEGAAWSLASVLAAASDRLSPILITACLIVLGLAPLVVGGDQPGGEILRPMAGVILGGLASGTAFGLLILPILIHHFWQPTTGRGGRADAAEV
jgi:CzcA family heavy metal efflux pump